MSSAKSFTWDVLASIMSGISLTKIRNKTGPNTLPWGTPLMTSEVLDGTPFTTTRCVLPLKKDSIHFNKLPVMPYASSFFLQSLTRYTVKSLAEI